jgi:purine-binding chemotaxis protein CheW
MSGLAAPVRPAAQQCLLLSLGGLRCALPREAVREVLPLPRLWHPPGLPKPLLGFMNLDGAAWPVLDLARLFGLPGEAGSLEDALYRHVLVANGPEPMALLVDRVLDLVRLTPGSFRPVAPERTLNGCVVAQLDLPGQPEGSLVHLLALDRILLAQESAALQALRQDAQRRLAEWPATG